MKELDYDWAYLTDQVEDCEACGKMSATSLCPLHKQMELELKQQTKEKEGQP